MATAKEFVKPKAQLTGENGNVFNIIGIVCRALVRAGYPEKAEEWKARAISGKYDYDQIIGKLVHEYAEVS